MKYEWAWAWQTGKYAWKYQTFSIILGGRSSGQNKWLEEKRKTRNPLLLANLFQHPVVQGTSLQGLKKTKPPLIDIIHYLEKGRDTPTSTSQDKTECVTGTIPQRGQDILFWPQRLGRPL